MPTRDIPSRPWVKMGVFAFCRRHAVDCGVGVERADRISAFAPATSTTARRLGGARRAADAAPVTIVGDSRILFDTDLDRFQGADRRAARANRHRRHQCPRAARKHIANDPKFHGLLVVGMADIMLFREPCDRSRGTAIHNFAKNDKPRSSPGCGSTAVSSDYLAFLDSEYRLSRLAAALGPRHPQGRRRSLRRRLEDFRDVRSPAIFHVGSDRDGSLFARSCAPRVERFKGPPLPPSSPTT